MPAQKETAGAPPPDPLAYSVEQAAKAANSSRSALYEAIADGDLVARKRGARTIILPEDLKTYLANLPAIEPRRATA